MIKLYKNEIGKPENELPFEITKFPDGTSQVWRIKILDTATKITSMNVVWDFENEGEFLQVMQLGTLLSVDFAWLHRTLHMPFLMYGRQDKPVNNFNTFALNTMNDLFKFTGYFHSITSVDIHNPKATLVANIDPSSRINEVLNLTDTTLICFPDKGAALRGYKYDEEKYGAPIILDKNRNQETGEILGLKFALKLLGTGMLRSHSVLIVDDLCDGGRTFTEAAKLLKGKGGADKVYLYTTHGIYSKGSDILFDNGIDRVFNYKSELKRSDDIPF